MLTQAERSLVEHVERGAVLDFSDGVQADWPVKPVWGESRTIRAAVIREILNGQHVARTHQDGLRLRGARIEGRLDLRRMKSTVALELHGCLLSEGLDATGADLVELDLTDSFLEHPDLPVLNGTSLTVGLMVLTRASVVGKSPVGVVRLHSAWIKLALECEGTVLCSSGGPALNAEQIRVDGQVTLRNGFTASGGGERGTIRLFGARIRGFLDCAGATLKNSDGPALYADLAHVEGPVFLRGGFTADGAGASGAVRLAEALIGGMLDFEGAVLSNSSGPALVADYARVGRALRLVGTDLVGNGSDATAELSELQVGGRLHFTPARLENRSSERSRLKVDGLTYIGVPVERAEGDWLRLLGEATPEYAAQPYQQLAAAYRAAGHDGNARRALMAQRRDQIDRKALTGAAERIWARFTGLTLGYGYQPWRALLVLAAVLAAAAISAVCIGGQGGLVRNQSGAPPAACSVVERIGFGLDLGTPLLATGSRTRCEPADTSAGQCLTILGWVLRLLAWAFATLFIAGFTGAVRRT